MKIGITTFGADGGKSGISQYVINLLREITILDKEDHFELFVYENEKDVFVSNPDHMLLRCFGDNLRNPVLNLAWHQVGLPWWCKREAYDVLFLPAGNRRLPISAPCPMVGTVHDFSGIHVKEKYDPARTFYITRVLPFLVRRLNRVITDSESSKKDIVEYAGVPEERVYVIPLAVNNRLYFQRDKESAITRVRDRYDIRPPYILYISRIEHPGKNHVRLIRAFNRLKTSEQIPHQLVFVGSDWTRATEVHQTAKESGCARDIMFTGFVPTADLPDLYCGANLFIFPSLYEGFGLPVLEAMSCGVPVACSNLSSLPEVAGDAAVLFNPYDEDAIAKAMKGLLTDTRARDHYIRRGLERSKEFTWSNTARRTLEVIYKAVEENY
jgi:glycosyltransferase involved in cell wall biosynthesis